LFAPPKCTTVHADYDAVHLMPIAMVRSEFLSTSFTFSGNLIRYEKSVPPILLRFLNILLGGPGNADSIKREAAVSVQLCVMQPCDGEMLVAVIVREL